MKRSLTKKACNQWCEMTDNNLHTDCYKSVADYFGLSDFAFIFEGIEEKQAKQGYLECDDVMFRAKVLNFMMNKIEKENGSTVAAKVYKCL